MWNSIGLALVFCAALFLILWIAWWITWKIRDGRAEAAEKSTDLYRWRQLAEAKVCKSFNIQQDGSRKPNDLAEVCGSVNYLRHALRIRDTIEAQAPQSNREGLLKQVDVLLGGLEACHRVIMVWGGYGDWENPHGSKDWKFKQYTHSDNAKEAAIDAREIIRHLDGLADLARAKGLDEIAQVSNEIADSLKKP